jgi:hypothetical protein
MKMSIALHMLLDNQYTMFDNLQYMWMSKMSKHQYRRFYSHLNRIDLDKLDHM